MILAAAGESALKQELKETDTIQWYKGECTLKEVIKHIDPDNPKSLESEVRACINKKSYVSATDVNTVSGMFKATAERADINLFKRSLVLACYLAEDDYAPRKFGNGTINDTYLGDNERLVEKRVYRTCSNFKCSSSCIILIVNITTSNSSTIGLYVLQGIFKFGFVLALFVYFFSATKQKRSQNDQQDASSGIATVDKIIDSL